MARGRDSNGAPFTPPTPARTPSQSSPVSSTTRTTCHRPTMQRQLSKCSRLAMLLATLLVAGAAATAIESPQAAGNYTEKGELEYPEDSEYPEDEEDAHCLASRRSSYITIVLYSLVCIVGLFGNTLVIYVVLRFSRMQTVTNIYILNLAVADECFLIGIPFLLHTMRTCSWRFGEYMCKAYMVSTSITQFTSSIFLLIMSADRYIAVCHPISSPRYRTVANAKLVSSLAWLISALLMLPVVLYANAVPWADGINYSCNIDWPDVYRLHSGATFIVYTLVLGFAAPLLFIMGFYCLVLRKLHAVAQKHRSKEKRRSHRKVTRLVLTVITVYVCCWLPYWISQVALTNSNPSQRDLSRLEVLVFLLLGCLVYSNSAVNPILYAFLSDNFRKSFRKAFVCVWPSSLRRRRSGDVAMDPSGVPSKVSSRRRRRGRDEGGGGAVQVGGGGGAVNAVEPPRLVVGRSDDEEDEDEGGGEPVAKFERLQNASSSTTTSSAGPKVKAGRGADAERGD